MKTVKIHLYHGDGKGKTTAAIGLAVRAAGAGKKVMFTQFMKGNDTSELKILEGIGNIEIARARQKYPFYKKMTENDKKKITEEHNEILSKIKIFSEKEDDGVVIMDEVTYPYNWDLMDKAMLLDILDHKSTEIVMTGRNPAKELLQRADYITEMKMIKHPYMEGVAAREGIEY